MIIAADIDDVILDFVLAMVDHNSSNFGTQLTKEQHYSFSFKDVWRVELEEADRRLISFFKSKDFLNIQPRLDALTGIEALKVDGHHLYAVSSRHDDIREYTFEWLEKYFPLVFTEIHFSSNVHTSRASGKSKQEILIKIGADIFIEDNLAYAVSACKVVKKVILFNHPWNKSLSVLPRNLVRVNNWYDSVNEINSLVA